MSIRTAIVGMLLSLASFSAAIAEIPNRTPQQLREGASQIVTGKVQQIYSMEEKSGDYVFTRSVAAVSVDAVEKGVGISKGELVYVRFWRKKYVGAGRPAPGHFGHRGIPAVGDVVRIYLKKADDGGFDVVGPNGFDVVKSEEQ